MKTRKIIIGFCLLFLGIFAQAQNGLENVYVERYYVANAADAAGSSGTLAVGSVTYRIYADMLPGYKLQTVFGIPAHPMLINTTTSFFNNTDYGATTPGFSATNAKKNTVMLDSWLTTGGACAAYNGILKSEDNGVGNFVNTNGLLQNNAAQAGIALTTQDGMLTGTVPNTGTLGLDAVIGVFGDGTANGNSFLATDGSWYCLAGAAGAVPATNKVLIAQMTTNGTFHFELNIQIGTPTGGTENYVFSNPTGVELTIPSLTQTFLAVPLLPTVSITAPTGGSTFAIGSPVSIAATAADADGTVSSVEFFVDGVSIGIDATSPFTSSYTGVSELSHVLTAKATDNEGFSTTSTPVSFNVGNSAPVVSITAPTAGSVYVVGDVVSIAASATDADGTVSSVEFFVDAVSAGVDNSSPYTATYTSAVGTHSLTAKATDNLGKFTTSAAVSITVNVNQLPSVAITAPVNGATPALNAALTLTATATDSDGTISGVQFYSGATSLGSGVLAAGVYSFTYTPVVQGPIVLTAKATDNKGGITTSAPISVTITDFSVTYAVTFTTQPCNLSSACMPIRAIVSATNVSGYNITVAYDKTKVSPTGVVTVSNALLLPYLAGGNAADITDYATSIDAVAGRINIAIYFNSSASASAVFNGIGDVCCVEFNKLAAFQTADVAIFSLPEIIESYQSLPSASKTGSSGNLITFRDVTFAGSLKFWSDLTPIKYDPLSPSTYLITNIYGCGSVLSAVQPDLSGNFSYSTLNGTTIDIKRDIAAATDVQAVINGADALIAATVSVKGAFVPVVYQMIAMDVNRDGLVTAGDATQILRRAVSLIPEFSQVGALGKDWSFIEQNVVTTNPNYTISATFPEDDGVGFSKYRSPVVAVCQAVPTDGADCPTILDESYLGVMIGDVNATYASISANGTIKSVSADTAQIIINLANATFSNGTMSIPVSLSSTDIVNSFDFSFLLNNVLATVQSVENQNSLLLSWNYIAAESKLLVSSYSLESIPTSNTASIVLTLATATPITSSDFTEILALVNGLTANMVIIDATTGIGEQKEAMIQVYPNPASDILNIEVSEDSKVQLLDLNGKQVVAEQSINANQKKTIDVSNLSAGVYMVKIYNDKFVSMKKAIIRK